MTDKLWDVFFATFRLALCIFIVGIIPGLIWLISDFAIEILKLIDKGVFWFFDLSLIIKIIIDVVGGVCLFFWYFKHKSNPKH